MSDSTDPPSHLSAAAKAAWAEQFLVGQETAASLALLESMSVQIARARDAQARIDGEGIVIADPKGNPVPHPAIAIERAAQVEIVKLAAARPKERLVR